MITKTDYPKGFEAFKEYLKAIAARSIPPNTPPELVSRIVSDDMTTLAMSRPDRILYDFFDSVKITVCVWKPSEDSGWIFRVGNGVPMSGLGGMNRKDAESRAFVEAFKKFENK